jgi:hypothetical protein
VIYTTPNKHNQIFKKIDGVLVQDFWKLWPLVVPVLRMIETLAALVD